MAAEKTTASVLIAGAGISGIRAAIELAETGYKVLLTDSSNKVGGILAKLDYQYPTDHCGMCRMLPMVGREYSSEYCMRKSLYHENIEILPFTEIDSIEGTEGNYSVHLVKKPRYIDSQRCNELGKCLDVCPVEVPDEFNHGLTTRKAIYQAVPHNVPSMLLIDRQNCTECGACIDVCYPGAINLFAEEEREIREIQAIILASGVELYNLQDYDDAKSYAVSEDVVTALAFERMLSSTGTFKGGKITRPSDNKPVQKIAWIQCMGSRNLRQKRDYCSSVCCMFALKEAVLAKEKGGEQIDTTIFYMDMRTYGKGFHRYREKAVNEHGVKLIRCRVQEVSKLGDGSLQIRYFSPETNSFFTDIYDLVVMSTGQVPFEDHSRWSKLLGTELDQRGLLQTENYSKTSLKDTPGAFMCGSLMGLTDISEAMSSGIAAAGEATTFLHQAGLNPPHEEFADEPQTDNSELPAVAVLICKCAEFSGTEGLDLEMLAQAINSHPGVGAVHIVESVCTGDGEQSALTFLERSGCNRLLLGACQPYMYRRKLKDIARKAGFNSSLIQIIDLLSIARRGLTAMNKREWTMRAASEILADLESLKLKPALPVKSMPINQTALVVGGGMAGMHAALSLAGRGVAVHLVERSAELGGHLGNSVISTIDGLTPIETASRMKMDVYEQKNITVHLNTRVVSSTGMLGSFESTLEVDSVTGTPTTEYLHHGAAIIATGGKEGNTDEYCNGASKNILTQAQLKKQLEDKTLDLGTPKDIVMIQCAGSREPGKRVYCSRICCMWAVTNAISIKEKNPDCRVFVLYRDMMTYGFTEQYYTRAREAGVIFTSYSLKTRPEVTLNDQRPQVTFYESVLGQQANIDADYLVLSTGVDPETSNGEIANTFGIELNEDGFFNEADTKWRPIEFQQLGVFLAGLAHSPMPLKDVLMQAEAAAQKTYGYLAGKELYTAKVTSTVREALCVRCQRCIVVCPYDARSFNQVENRINIDPAGCQGCGMCAVACRNNAAEIPGWSDQQTLAVIDQKLMDDLQFEP